MSRVVETINIFYQILSFPLRALETIKNEIWYFFMGLGGYPSLGPSQVINQVITFRLVPCMKLFLEQCRNCHENKIPHRVNKLNAKSHFLIQRGRVQV